MSRSLSHRPIGVLATGILLGALAVLVAGPIRPPDREGRLVIDAAYVASVRDARTRARGRPPGPGELAGVLEREIDSDILAREAAVRGLVANPEGLAAGGARGSASGAVRHLRRVAATRWLSAPTTEAELVAFVEFRRDRYGELFPPDQGLPPPGAPEWTRDPDLAALLARARGDVRTAERSASANQFFAEIAPRHPVILSREARAVLDAGTGSDGTPDGEDAGARRTGYAEDGEDGERRPVGVPAVEGSSGWPGDPGDPWSGAASVFLEEAGEGRYDLTVLLPPGVADEELQVRTACASEEKGTVIPVFGAGADPRAPSWRVGKGSLRCPPGAVLWDGELGVSAPAGVRGDLEIRRLDGATLFGTFEGGNGGIAPDSGGVSSAGPLPRVRDGLVDILGIPALWVLGLALGLRRPGAGVLGLATAGFGGGYALGRWTAGTGGPTTFFGVPEILTLLAVGTLAIAWAFPRDGAPGPRPFEPSPGIFALLGLLFGGTGAAALAAPLSQGARWMDAGTGLGGSIAGGAGAALALVPMMAAGVGAASVRGLGRPGEAGKGPLGSEGRLVGWALGVGGVAGAVALAYSSWVAFPPPITGAELGACSVAGALGVLLALSGARLEDSDLTTAGLLVVAGLALPAIGPAIGGWGGYSAAFLSGTVLAGCLFAAGLLSLGASSGRRTGRARRALRGVGAVGSLGIGLHLSSGTGPPGGAASSSALGGAAVALTLGWLAARAAAMTPEARRPRALRVAAFGALALAVALRLPDYLGAFGDSVRADLAFGRLPIPLLALALGTVALVLRPRRRRVPEALGMARRRRYLHLWPAAGAFLLLPFGLLHVPLPLPTRGVPGEDDARRIVGQLLTDTYEAFDLTEEEALYDRLAETVTGELLPTLFLENRRGLASGAGDATEVSVLDVVVAPGGTVSEARGAGPAFTWTGEWAVRARVAHLVHVHLRQNLYTGRVVVRAEPEGWKLDAVELTAEERVARPWEGP